MGTAPRDRKNVRSGILTGLCVIVFWYLATWMIRPISLEPGVLGRLELAVSWLFLLSAPLIVAVGLVAHHRFYVNRIDGGWDRNDRLLEIFRANLSNTVEQVVIAVPVHLALALTVPADWLWVLPATVMLFLLGRVMFLRGYLGERPTGRAAGFVCTFYPNVLLFLLALISVVARPLWEVEWPL